MTVQLTRQADPIARLDLPIELTNGNEGRTRHYKKSHSQRKKYESIISLIGGRRTPFDHPVVVVVTRILGRGQAKWDASSFFRGNYKEIEDAMVALGWFADDSPKWIPLVIAVQDGNARKGNVRAEPSIRIEIFNAVDIELS
ncbi:MAG: hypothetical protein AAF236_02265 [Verrucomicrobiota bacterium]